ncbi:Uncharacterised protein [Mycobacteroides abscessus]|nr:Uncharacterised protein [Mycobacteroides abscessus]
MALRKDLEGATLSSSYRSFWTWRKMCAASACRPSMRSALTDTRWATA